MSLEEVVKQISLYLTTDPLKATFDIGGHALSGLFLTERYFPELSKKKKALFSLFGGLAPDFDYFTLGYIKHKSMTHSVYYAGLVAGLFYYFNKEDSKKYYDSKNKLEGLKNEVKRFISSRYVKFAAFGIGIHLGMDNFHHYNQKLLYCLAVGTALSLQVMANKRYNRYFCYDKLE